MFLIKHFINYLLTLCLASIVIFIVLEILPGDPALHMLGLNASDSALASLRHELGLDRPALERYGHWVLSFIQGDFGMSFRYQTSVADLIQERLFITLPIAFLTMVISVFFGFILSIVAAHYHQQKIDHALSTVTEFGLAIPEFWVGIMLILFLALPYALFPIGGFPGWENGFWKALHHLILPVIALSIMQTAILFRYARGVIIDIQNEDYIRTARGYGLPQYKITFSYILPVALLSIFSLLGMQITSLLTGTIIIEMVFNIPGLGHLLFHAVEQRDLTVIKNLVLLFISFVVLVHFIIDILHNIFDPRHYYNESYL